MKINPVSDKHMIYRYRIRIAVITYHTQHTCLCTVYDADRFLFRQKLLEPAHFSEHFTTSSV